MSTLPIKCPSCQNALVVSQLSCEHCQTRISGKYALPAFMRLPKEDQEFIFQFVMSGGSLKKMAAQIEKSYPTVRNLLDDIIEKLENEQK